MAVSDNPSSVLVEPGESSSSVHLRCPACPDGTMHWDAAGSTNRCPDCGLHTG